MLRKTVLVILHLQAMFPQCSRNNLSVRATDKLLNFFFFRSCIIKLCTAGISKNKSLLVPLRRGR